MSVTVNNVLRPSGSIVHPLLRDIGIVRGTRSQYAQDPFTEEAQSHPIKGKRALTTKVRKGNENKKRRIVSSLYRKITFATEGHARERARIYLPPESNFASLNKSSRSRCQRCCYCCCVVRFERERERERER